MLLQLDNISKSYPGGRPGMVRKVISSLTWSLEAGAAVAITGRSGSGKSTLLNLIGTLDRPDQGTIRFKGVDLSGMSARELGFFRNRSIGFVFQMHHLLPQLTVIENVLVPTLAIKPHRSTKDELLRAEYLLKEVDLWDLKDQHPGRLSGGECQRVAVVRALINKPDLLLADEPTGALDEESALNLIRLLKELQQKESFTLIMVSHAAEMVSKMDRSYQLKQGTLIEPAS